MPLSIGISKSQETEADFILGICKSLYTHGSDSFGLDSLYDATGIREAFPDDDDVEKMIAAFEKSYTGDKLTMGDFYRNFEYNAEPFVGRNKGHISNTNYLWACKRLYQFGGNLAPHKTYNPDKIRASLKGDYIEDMITSFEKSYTGDKLTMGDFYTYFDMQYKQSSTALIQKNLGRVASHAQSILISSQDIFNIRHIVSYILSASVGSYVPFAHMNNHVSPEYYQNNSEKYSGAIDNLYTSGMQVIDIDFIASINNEDISIDEIRGFHSSVMCLVDDIKGIDPESKHAGTIGASILNKYTNLFDSSNSFRSDEILSFIENNGQQSVRLQSFKKALLGFHALLIEQNINTPEDDNNLYKPLIYRREEDELGDLEERKKLKTFIPFDSHID